MNNPDCILLLSGGLDSAVLLAKLRAEKRAPVSLSLRYGSKHNDREIQAAINLAKEYSSPHHIVALDFMTQLLSSSLLIGGSELPKGTYSTESVKQTVVPFRNGIFLSIATALAEELKTPRVFIASHANDYAVYPDCRPEFTAAFSKATQFGTYAKVEIVAPFAVSTKKEIADLGRKLKVDFLKTWSCYAGGQRHCGVCSTCTERKRALRFDEGLDPTVYL